jgi:2-oxoglutarate ferredoxin oxidoreductase subunit alpha
MENENMAEKILMTGNIAAAEGAIYAGCKHYVGYPITPQSDVVEYFAEKLPRIGGEFVQAESECTSINMLYGAAACGIRAMTSTSSPGYSLMQEGISHIAAAQLPCVIMHVQRGGPGSGTTQTAQMDYNQVVKGGGHGEYHLIVLAPSSVQELFDFVQLGFHLAEKYRNIAMILSDAIIGQMKEDVELRTLNFGPAPEDRSWALKIHRSPKGKSAHVHSAVGIVGIYNDWLKEIQDKYDRIKRDEVRYQSHLLDDAELALVSFGSSARAAMGACKLARDAGLKVGVFRPITLWPFPERQLEELASRVKKFLVVEDNLGQMVADVRAAVAGQAEVNFMGILSRHMPDCNGMILPDTIFEEVKRLL